MQKMRCIFVVHEKKEGVITMVFKKESTNLYFVAGSIGVSLIFYLLTLLYLQKDIASGSSAQMYNDSLKKESR